MKKGLIFIISVMAVLFTGCRREESPQDLEISLRKNWSYASVPISLGTDIDVSSSTKAISDDNWIEEIELQGSAETKSSVSIEAVEKFVKARLYAFYKSGNNWYVCEDGESETHIDVTSKTFKWSLPTNVPLKIFVLVNYGDLLLPDVKANTLLEDTGVLNVVFTCESPEAFKSLEGANYGLPMAGIIETTLKNEESPINIKVKRLYAKYNIYFDTGEFDDNNYTVHATYIRTAQANSSVPFFSEGYKVPNNEDGAAQVKYIDYGTSSDITDLNKESASNQVTLFFLENCQGNKSGASKWYDVNNVVSDVRYMSYIELGVSATDNATGLPREFIYYIYLGDDCTTNFDVRRNVFKSLKVKLPFNHETCGFKFTNANQLSIAPGETIYIPYETTINPNSIVTSFNGDGINEVSPYSSKLNETKKTNYKYEGLVEVTAQTDAEEGIVYVVGGDGVNISDKVGVIITTPLVLDVNYTIQNANDKYVFQAFTVTGLLKANDIEAAGLPSVLSEDMVFMNTTDNKFHGFGFSYKKLSSGDIQFTFNAPVPKVGDTTYQIEFNDGIKRVSLGSVTVTGKKPNLIWKTGTHHTSSGIQLFSLDLSGKNVTELMYSFTDDSGNELDDLDYYDYGGSVSYRSYTTRDCYDAQLDVIMDYYYDGLSYMPSSELLDFETDDSFGVDDSTYETDYILTGLSGLQWLLQDRIEPTFNTGHHNAEPYGKYYYPYDFIIEDMYHQDMISEMIMLWFTDPFFGIGDCYDLSFIVNCSMRSSDDWVYYDERHDRNENRLLRLGAEGLDEVMRNSAYNEIRGYSEGLFCGYNLWNTYDGEDKIVIDLGSSFGHLNYGYSFQNVHEGEPYELYLYDIEITRVYPIYAGFNVYQKKGKGSTFSDAYLDAFIKTPFSHISLDTIVDCTALTQTFHPTREEIKTRVGKTGHNETSINYDYYSEHFGVSDINGLTYRLNYKDLDDYSGLGYSFGRENELNHRCIAYRNPPFYELKPFTSLTNIGRGITAILGTWRGFPCMEIGLPANIEFYNKGYASERASKACSPKYNRLVFFHDIKDSAFLSNQDANYSGMLISGWYDPSSMTVGEKYNLSTTPNILLDFLYDVDSFVNQDLNWDYAPGVGNHKNLFVDWELTDYQ